MTDTNTTHDDAARDPRADGTTAASSSESGNTAGAAAPGTTATGNVASAAITEEQAAGGTPAWAADFEALRVSERPDRLHVALDRPDVRNAIDQVMVDELHTVCGHLEREPKIMVLSGTRVNGKGIFASGADIAQLRERRREDALRGVNSQIFDRIAKLPMPVVAALDGYALGGGAELAWAADFRIGTPRLKVGQPETGLGIIAAAGALWRLKELAGEALAKDILMAGRILSADEALEARLITEIHEPDELLTAADALADRIAAQDPLAVRISKRVFAMPREAHPHVDELAQAVLFESQAKFDRMQAFLDRKKEPKK
ncbi:enoyl-CoA hydratase/isomerase family protein [Kocuria rhizophila]|uniref:enoyl-CoA hydratase/isomerase family protein n=1 Tax=Kocuria rhizophila TaxID=72000 RepID=UPI001EF550D9|nr:enoyl-CoA hydratase/isomerase family protein [Kocuria rhizophila]MCG7424245.1 enoyl-CoA hydratase/isomerase family protein [Kocuria rhizophila]MCT1457259.1 enoyl-CoA hydratase/isomerase family protein [Kocuria rhizophila]MCT2249206.1 enoyl-CoA hydratase/isomerase family protein [Kocuria rhizophila]